MNSGSCLPVVTSFSLATSTGGAGHVQTGEEGMEGNWVQMLCTPELDTAWGGKAAACTHAHCPPASRSPTQQKSEPGIVLYRGQELAARAARVSPVLPSGPLLAQKRSREGGMPAHPPSSFHYSRLAPSPEQGSRNNSAVYKAARTRSPSHTNSLNQK